MKYGEDRIRISCYDEKDEKSCSIVVGHMDTLYLCTGKRKLEIAEHELYHLIKEFIDKH